MKPHLTILTGPTASGKTALALDWAQKTGGWILSCDALLFYKEADIGTAKPTPSERSMVPHFGIDLCPADQVFDVRSYILYATDVLERAAAEERPVLVTGGSGFYLSAFNDPPPDELKIPLEIRNEVDRIATSQGIEGLRERLLSIDANPDVDLNNPRRVAPALERCLASGLTTRELRRRHQETPCPFEKWQRSWYLLNPPKETLERRIDRRTKRMLEEGLVAEVEDLLTKGILCNPTLRSAIGYRESLEHLENPGELSTLAGEISLHTRKLAQRQRRWFRNRLPECREISSVEEMV